MISNMRTQQEALSPLGRLFILKDIIDVENSLKHTVIVLKYIKIWCKSV